MNDIYEALLSDLKNRNFSYNDFYKKNRDKLTNIKVSEYWADIFRIYKVKKTDIINKSDIGYTYFYDILRGKKHPSRDVLLKIFLAMDLPLEECQKCLAIYSWANLNPFIKRDSIVIYGLFHKLTLTQLQSLLEENGENTL
ncbi:MAG: hypothetical protein J6D06_07810 [Clostridia bacterium]|nr:hypothetical protein [Clostridia bacterium]